MNHQQTVIARDNRRPVTHQPDGRIGVVENVFPEGTKNHPQPQAMVLFLGDRLAQRVDTGDLDYTTTANFADSLDALQKGAEGND